ncbi:T9SS type A sorting domain-containing protein [Geofilum rubicundum]|uniref:Secretion system C-terminal sorting domain-containing protein n=1 Tax=Geofilum rubicundum JCM 15548 TaxID=1236989 RepID=A0A0E9LX72_9BACT|nr:T9SS type A sorting domain-containing protein [Geofilum rubicundum]GAO29450.1 hypothetical protein JCM15548_11637 [Geofilum rubicundum JCM 15548]
MFAGYTVMGSSLKVQQNVLMDVGSDLFVRLDRTTGVSDRLVVNGSFSAAGTLILAGSGGSYAAGQQYHILDAGSISGKFDNILPETPADGLYWDTSELYTDGVVKVSDQATSLREWNAGGLVTIYPNPVMGVLNVDWSAYPTEGEAIQLTLYNLVGEQVLTCSLQESPSAVDVSALPAGLYLLQLMGFDGVFTQKVMIR